MRRWVSRASNGGERVPVLPYASLIGAVAFGLGTAVMFVSRGLDELALTHDDQTVAAAPTRMLTVRPLKSDRPAHADVAQSASQAERGPTSVAPVELESAVPARRKAIPRSARPVAATPAAATGEIYRTVCVRLCDGGYFPISAATTKARFAEDAAQCSARCDVPAKLFVAPVGDASPARFVDLTGAPYAQLAAAFKFQTTYTPACACRAQPWQQEAADRHRAFALQWSPEPAQTPDVVAVRDQKDRRGETSELAMLEAVGEVRRVKSPGLAPLWSLDVAPLAARSPIVSDRAPVVGGLDTDAGEKPVIALRFIPPLKPAAHVYDATGRVVYLKSVTKPTSSPLVTILARADDVGSEPAPQPTTASLATASALTTSSLGPRIDAREIVPSVASQKPDASDRSAADPALNRSGKATGQRASVAAAKAPNTGVTSAARSGAATAKSVKTAKAAKAGRAANMGKASIAASVSAPRKDRTAAAGTGAFGQRLFNGSDWRLVAYQTLE